ARAATGGTGELFQPLAMEEGLGVAIREGGRTVGSGRATKVLKGSRRGIPRLGDASRRTLIPEGPGPSDRSGAFFMSEEMTGCEVPGTGTTRPSLSSQWGRTDRSPGSGRRAARGIRAGSTGRPGDRAPPGGRGSADGPPAGQGQRVPVGRGQRAGRGVRLGGRRGAPSGWASARILGRCRRVGAAPQRGSSGES